MRLWTVALYAEQETDWLGYWEVMYYLGVTLNSWFQYFDLDCRPWVFKLLSALSRATNPTAAVRLFGSGLVKSKASHVFFFFYLRVSVLGRSRTAHDDSWRTVQP